MITKKEILKEIDGHANAYSTFTLINVNPDEVIEVLNEIRPNGCFGTGEIGENYFSFEGSKEYPEELLPELTEKLKCIGYADMGSWYGSPEFMAFRNGREYDGYTAEFEPGYPCNYSEEDQEEPLYDVLVTVTDNVSGVKIPIGEGCLPQEDKEYYEEIVNSHTKKDS